MKNRIYKYFFYEFIRYFTIVVFALTAIIWTIQAVNFLDLVTDDGHAFMVYLFYSSLTIPKILTKLIPFSFLIAAILTILKLEKDNELIILWTSGLNKIHIVNLILRISILIVIVQLLMSTFVNPETLKISRNILKNSELQFVPSLLKEKQFNDTVKGLTIFVDKKNANNIYENIFIRDEGKVLTNVSTGSSTIFAKSGYVTDDEKKLVLVDGNIQKVEASGSLNIIKFNKTEINLHGLATKTISAEKIQETSTISLISCLLNIVHKCSRNENMNLKEIKIELNKRFGMPIFIPLVALICCFLLSSRQEKKISFFQKYIYGILGIIVIIISEITVRYSGISLEYSLIYYLIPIGLIPITYFLLVRTFKYENLN